MWIKLTLYRDTKRVQLVNTNDYESIEQMDGFTCLWHKRDPEGTSAKHVVETIAEIELMLMGSKASPPDPRERNVIGGRLTEHGWRDQMAKDAAGWNNE